MASHSSCPTETMVREAEEHVPHQTLRLVLKEASNADFDKECEKAKQTIVDKIKEALDANVEEMRTFLKSQKPKMDDSKTPEEYEKEVEKFKHALQIMKGLMEDQTNFNAHLLDEVGKYLQESWNMIEQGKSEEECKRFRNERRRQLCDEFETKATEIKDTMQNAVAGDQGGHHGGDENEEDDQGKRNQGKVKGGKKKFTMKGLFH